PVTAADGAALRRARGGRVGGVERVPNPDRRAHPGHEKLRRRPRDRRPRATGGTGGASAVVEAGWIKSNVVKSKTQRGRSVAFRLYDFRLFIYTPARTPPNRPGLAARVADPDLMASATPRWA